MRDFFLARTLKGSYGGSSRPETDFPTFLRWFKEGMLPLDKLVTKRYRLDEINEACDALSRGRINGRSIIEY
jgi:Zn-dependent alcohol dehydrogenase